MDLFVRRSVRMREAIGRSVYRAVPESVIPVSGFGVQAAAVMLRVWSSAFREIWLVAADLFPVLSSEEEVKQLELVLVTPMAVQALEVQHSPPAHSVTTRAVKHSSVDRCRDSTLFAVSSVLLLVAPRLLPQFVRSRGYMVAQVKKVRERIPFPKV